jgi:hypothetical protein
MCALSALWVKKGLTNKDTKVITKDAKEEPDNYHRG